MYRPSVLTRLATLRKELYCFSNFLNQVSCKVLSFVYQDMVVTLPGNGATVRKVLNQVGVVLP